MHYVCEITTVNDADPGGIVAALTEADASAIPLSRCHTTRIEIMDHRVQFLDTASESRRSSLVVIAARDLNDVIRQLQRAEVKDRWQVVIHPLPVDAAHG